MILGSVQIQFTKFMLNCTCKSNNQDITDISYILKLGSKLIKPKNTESEDFILDYIFSLRNIHFILE